MKDQQRENNRSNNRGKNVIVLEQLAQPLLWRSYEHWESPVENLNNSANKYEQAAVSLLYIHPTLLAYNAKFQIAVSSKRRMK